MKYVIIETESGLPAAIIFNEVLNHADVAGRSEVLGAGFCQIKNGNVSVMGYSQGLKINSKLEDADYIKMAIELTMC